MIAITLKRAIMFVGIALIVVIVVLWYFEEQTHFDTQSKLYFITQPKEIAAKDFHFIAQYFAPEPTPNETVTHNEEVLPATPTQHDLEPHTPPQLFAIMNKRALIDEEWRNLHEVFTHGGVTYRVRSIAQNSITLQQDDGAILSLEVSITPQELIIQVR